MGWSMVAFRYFVLFYVAVTVVGVSVCVVAVCARVSMSCARVLYLAEYLAAARVLAAAMRSHAYNLTQSAPFWLWVS